MSAVDVWVASRREQLELMQHEVHGIHTVADDEMRGERPVCSVCGALTRRNLQNGSRYCDMHPTAPVRWVRYPEEDN